MSSAALARPIALFLLSVAFPRLLWANDTQLCGPRCVFFATHMSDIHMPLDEILEVGGKGRGEAWSLADLRRVVEALGGAAVPVQCDLSTVEEWGCPAVLFLTGPVRRRSQKPEKADVATMSHFVLYFGSSKGGEGSCLFDPPSSTRLGVVYSADSRDGTRQRVEGVYGGRALVLAFPPTTLPDELRDAARKAEHGERRGPPSGRPPAAQTEPSTSIGEELRGHEQRWLVGVIMLVVGGAASLATGLVLRSRMAAKGFRALYVVSAALFFTAWLLGGSQRSEHKGEAGPVVELPGALRSAPVHQVGARQALANEMELLTELCRRLRSETDPGKRRALAELVKEHRARADALADPLAVLDRAKAAFFHRRYEDVLRLLQLYSEDVVLFPPATSVIVIAHGCLGEDEEALALTKRMLTSDLPRDFSEAKELALAAACSCAARARRYDALLWCYQTILREIPYCDKAGQAASGLEVLYRHLADGARK